MKNEKLKYLLKGGIDHYNFKRIIFSQPNRIWFDKVSYVELKEIVNSIKSNSIGLYTFLPFCYMYLGIDLFYYYKEQLNNEWRDCLSCFSIVKDFERYNIKLHYENELMDTLDRFGMRGEYLNRTRKRLIEQGANPVIFLEIIGSINVKYFPVI